MSAWVLGVDIGSGWAAGAALGVASGARPDVLVVGGDRRVPCTVVLTEDGRLLSGAFAHRAARRLPDRAERDPRRYAGRSPMLLGGTPVAAGDALAALLALFVAEGRRRHDGRDPVRVALTHPAGWAEDRLAALRAAAARVVPGAEVLLVPEPVAVTAHDTHRDTARDTPRDPVGDAGREGAGPARGPGAVAVLDVGATSFDVAVVVPGAERPEAAASDPDLGGELFDQLVLHALGEQLALSAPGWWREVGTLPDRTWLAAAADLAEEARLAREALTDAEVTARYVPGADVDVRLTRAELDAVLDDEVGRGVRLVARTLDAGPGPGAGAVLVTGGAGVTPLVLARLRERFGPRVRLVDDPQAAAALGAARLAAAPADRAPAAAPAPVPSPGPRLPAQSPPGPPPSPAPVAVPSAALPAVPPAPAPAPRPGRPAAPTAVLPAGGPDPAVLDAAVLNTAVLDARVVDGRLYTWSAPGEGAHRVARVDPATGRAEREVVLDRLVGWAPTAAGVLVCERRGGGELVCHVLDPDLRTTARVPLPTRYRPHLVAAGGAAWAVLRSPDTRTTPGPGPGPAEVGTLAVQTFPFGGRPGPVHALGAALYRYTDPARLLLDAGAPGSGPPTAGGAGCTVVVGRPGSARQVVWSIGAAGPPVRLADRRAGPWLHRVGGGPGRWWTTGAAGLEERADLGPGPAARPVLPRPPGGGVDRPAGGFAVTVGTADGRDAALHAVDGGAARVLGRWPALAGSPLAVRAAAGVAARADGDALLLGVVRADGRGAVVRATAAGVHELGSVPGRLEPVGRVGDVLLARAGDPERPGELLVLP